MLQMPIVFAAMLLFSFSVSGFRCGLKGEAAAVHFRETFLAFLIFLACFIFNVLNMFTAILFKGVMSEISQTLLYIFMEVFLALVPAMAVTTVLFVTSASGIKAGQKIGFTKEFFLSLKDSLKWSVFLVLSAAFIFTGQRSSVGIHVDSFISFQAADLAGSPVDQTIFADHDLTLINVWATFCGPCKAEMPDLAELNEEYQSQGFQVVGICGDIADEATGQLRQSEYEDALVIVQETHADTYLNLNPAGDLMTGFIHDHVPAYPTSLFVDSKGNQVGDMVVGSRDKDAWKAEIEKRLEMIAAGSTAAGSTAAESTAAVGTDEDSAQGFVSLAEAVPDVILEIRYYSTYNFVGDRIDGYNEPCALLTKEAAQALKGAAQDAKEQGYMLKIYDAYRPQSAVDNFIEWAEDTEDTRMKEYFYPELDKSVLFDQGYIAEKSGHSRGSTLDLTLFDMETGKDVDMGGTFDYFGELSHPDYTGDLTEEQIANRNILRDIMIDNGFRPFDTEWWHFTLEGEPYPDTYFTFPVEKGSVPEMQKAQ